MGADDIEGKGDGRGVGTNVGLMEGSGDGIGVGTPLGLEDDVGAELDVGPLCALPKGTNTTRRHFRGVVATIFFREKEKHTREVGLLLLEDRAPRVNTDHSTGYHIHPRDGIPHRVA